jgi:DNA-binding transcriptional LysR family regulator
MSSGTDRDAAPPPSIGAASINLASIDLNLLVALNALLQQCNVTHAAGMVGLSQPAMSRILAKLRGMFDDDLLVRTSSGYVRTMLGEWLYEHLPPTLDSIRKIVSPRLTAVGDWLATVRLAMPDHQALLLGKPVTERLSHGERNRELAIEPLTGDVLRRLETGSLEMAVGEISGTATGFYQRILYTDDYACLLSPNHLMLDCDWTPQHFYDLHHALSTPAQGGEPDHVADALATGAHRSHCMISPNTMSAAMAIIDSDMILTLPKRAAVRVAAILNLRIKNPPIAINPYRAVLLWHERSHRDPEHEWLRSQIASAAKSGALENYTQH